MRKLKVWALAVICTTTIFFFSSFFNNITGQNHSLSPIIQQELTTKAGLNYTMEANLASFQNTILFAIDGVHYQSRMLITVASHGKSRFSVYPQFDALFNSNGYQGYNTPVGVNWAKNWGEHITTNVAIQATLTEDFRPSYSPNVSLSYALIGNRYKSNKPINPDGLKITKADIVASLFAIISGIGGGANNAFHADAYVFEKKGWTGKYWKHNGWENNYPGGDYDEGEKPIKPEFLNGFRDVNHGSEDLELFGLTACLTVQGISEGIRLGNKRGKWWHTPVKMLGVQLIRIGVKKTTYNWLRS